MASSKASIEAGRGHITLTTRNELQKGLDEAEARFKALGSAIMGIGAAIAATGVLISAPFLKGLDTFSDWAKSARSAMRETGMSFNELDTATNGFRMTADDLPGVVAKMDAFLMNATQGSQDAARALSEMGISLADLQNATQGDRMLMFADGLNRISDAGQRIARQREVFGRGGLAVDITGGSQGVQARANRARYLQGDSMHSEAGLETGKAYNVAKKEFGMAMDGFWASLGMAAAPVMTEFFRMVMNITVSVREWTDANRPLLTTIFYIADKMILVGTVIGFVGAAIYAGAYAFAFIGGAITIVGGVIGTFLSLASGGFGLLTVLSWAWGAATFAASMLGAGGLLAYNVGLLTLTAITWAYSAAASVVGFLWGLLTGVSMAATGSTWLYTAALVAAWIWENIASLGITLLITALGALVIAIGVVVLAFGGFVLFGVAVAALPAIISALSGTFSDLFSAIGNSEWFGNLSNMFGAVVSTAKTAFSGMKDAFAIGDWKSLWEILKTATALEWEHISNYALDVFHHWKDTLVDVFTDVWTEIEIGATTAWQKIKEFVYPIIASMLQMTGLALAAIPGMEARSEALIAASGQMVAVPRSAAAIREEIEQRRNGEAADDEMMRMLRDLDLADENRNRVGELTGELEALTWQAEGERAIQEHMAWLNQVQPGGGGAGGSFTGAGSHVAGSFSAAVIAGFIGANVSMPETRGEREQRMARERLDMILEIQRDLQRRPGWAMG